MEKMGERMLAQIIERTTSAWAEGNKGWITWLRWRPLQGMKNTASRNKWLAKAQRQGRT